ncbi:MAG: arsenate reductase family protein [Vicinamibacterales bacterium]
MPAYTFYTKPTCTTCRNAKRHLEDAGVALTVVDINTDTPSRAFLEAHIDEERFLDFVSVRSPVFKTRPLPRTKAEAIDLMLENSNLIKRPVLVDGERAIFGFDRKAYAAAGIR